MDRTRRATWLLFDDDVAFPAAAAPGTSTGTAAVTTGAVTCAAAATFTGVAPTPAPTAPGGRSPRRRRAAFRREPLEELPRRPVKLLLAGLPARFVLAPGAAYFQVVRRMTGQTARLELVAGSGRATIEVRRAKLRVRRASAPPAPGERMIAGNAKWHVYEVPP